MPLLPRELRELPRRALCPLLPHGARPDQPHPCQQEAHAPMFGLPPLRRTDLQVLRGYTFTSCMPIGHHASPDPSLRALEASFIVAILVTVEGEPPRQLAHVWAALLPSLLPGRCASRYTITHLYAGMPTRLRSALRIILEHHPPEESGEKYT